MDHSDAYQRSMFNCFTKERRRRSCVHAKPIAGGRERRSAERNGTHNSFYRRLPSSGFACPDFLARRTFNKHCACSMKGFGDFVNT